MAERWGERDKVTCTMPSSSYRGGTGKARSHMRARQREGRGVEFASLGFKKIVSRMIERKKSETCPSARLHFSVPFLLPRYRSSTHYSDL